jgi:hypothetical protein
MVVSLSYPVTCYIGVGTAPAVTSTINGDCDLIKGKNNPMSSIHNRDYPRDYPIPYEVMSNLVLFHEYNI